MKLPGSCMAAFLLLLCTFSMQAYAGDIRSEQVAAMRSIDMKLYDFYMTYNQGLELCLSTCPSHADMLDDASGTLAALLDGTVSSIRGEHHEVINFMNYDADLLTANKKIYSRAAGCTPCVATAKRVQKYAQEGLPSGISRAALLHSEKYKQTPELQFTDGLLSRVRYRWVANGKKRSCRVLMPKTWEHVAPERAGRGFEFRSALGNGVPFFAIEYAPAKRIYSEDKILAALQHRVSAEMLSRQFGLVEILAQGVQKLGNTQSVWVMFAADGKGKNGAGYYYNWYMMVDGTLLMFQSGVNGPGRTPTPEQEQLFRRYYQTLREIAVSSVIG